jgi:hypothetical protein
MHLRGNRRLDIQLKRNVQINYLSKYDIMYSIDRLETFEYKESIFRRDLIRLRFQEPQKETRQFHQMGYL